MKQPQIRAAASETAAAPVRPPRARARWSRFARPFARPAAALLTACAVMLVLTGLAAAGVPVVPIADADAGYSATPQPAIHPLLSGGYDVQILAVLNEDPSINIVGAPNPSIDWGDGSTTTLNSPNEDPSIHYAVGQGPDNCTAPSGSLQVYAPGGACAFDLPLGIGGSLTGDHSYTQSGTYTVTVTYYTGFAIHYSTSWSVVIPGAPPNPTVDTLNLTVLQVDAAPYAGASGVIGFTPAPIGGGATTCPPNCNPTWSSGTTVTLTAVPAAGSSFAYWTSGQCGKGGCISYCPKTTNPCSVPLPQADSWAESDWVVFQQVPDSAPPAITAQATTADGAPYTAGTWTNQGVTVSFTCADTGTVQSGLASDTVAGATVSDEGANQSVTNTGQCVDNAGKSAVPVTFGPIMLDKTKPAITADATTADGQPYTAGTWTNQDVTVSFGCADAGSVQSGIATNTVAGQTLTMETAGQRVTNSGGCGDNAGNAADAASFGPVQIDETKPVISAMATTADGKPYTAGTWTNQNVTVSFACADTGNVQSGVATNTVTGQTLTSETSQAGQSVTDGGTCADAAGNVADPVTFGPILIDKTPPTMACGTSPSVVWPPDHKLVPVTTSVGVSDSLSDAAGFSIVSAVASGSPSDIQGFNADSPTSGQLTANKDETYTLTYQGADQAGNTAICTVTISVPHDVGQ